MHSVPPHEHGTLVATTLLKSNVKLPGGKMVALSFRRRAARSSSRMSRARASMPRSSACSICLAALKALASTEPAKSERQRRRQVRTAVVEIAEELANTPAVCRTSYVHDAVVAAFGAGALKRIQFKKAKSPATQAELLVRIVTKHGG
jgi:hypothetical protein